MDEYRNVIFLSVYIYTFIINANTKATTTITITSTTCYCVHYLKDTSKINNCMPHNQAHTRSKKIWVWLTHLLSLWLLQK